MFDKTFGRTTVYSLPIFPHANNLVVLGDNKRVLAEAANDFVFSFYNFFEKVIVFDVYNLFKKFLGGNEIPVISDKNYFNNLLQHLIERTIPIDLCLVILNAQFLNQDLILKLLKQQNNKLNIVLFYNEHTEKLYDIIFFTQEVIFFKTKNAEFLEISNRICLDIKYDFRTDFLLKELKGFLVCDMKKRNCEVFKANLGLKTHLIYNEITEILEILLKKLKKQTIKQF